MIKSYFLLKLIEELTYAQIDRILTVIEERYGEVEEDGSNQFILVNLNPIQTSVHLLKILDEIDNRYSVTGLRTSKLADTINAQAQSVLERLFYPQIMKYQLRQIDMMNRDSLFYLERLDAFDIMETHIMDRVMQEYWQGNLDVAGSFFETSTAYGILFKSSKGSFSKSQDFDYELDHRFYKSKDLGRV